jgi:hypothetical protein
MVLAPAMDAQEERRLRDSAEVLREAIAELPQR